MGFGIQNLGVINQKNAPAIWESNISEFPTNNIKGRLLLSLDTATLYVDLIDGNGDFTNRSIIAQGLISNGNGTIINTISPGDYSVDLGGALQNNTSIDLDGRQLNFIGANNTISINDNGDLIMVGTANGQFLPAAEEPLEVLVPNVTLYFINSNSGVAYRINAQTL
jgi:hypothetical protein